MLLGEYWAPLGEYWALLGECFRVLGLVASFTSTRYHYFERNIPDGIPSGILKFRVLPLAVYYPVAYPLVLYYLWLD